MIILLMRIGVSKIKVTKFKQKLANAIYHFLLLQRNEKRKRLLYKDDVEFAVSVFLDLVSTV